MVPKLILFFLLERAGVPNLIQFWFGASLHYNPIRSKAGAVAGRVVVRRCI